MTTIAGDSLTAPTLAGRVEQACARIAPTWPLDRFLAVNPYWGYVDRPIQVAAAELGAACGARLLMPRSFYLQQWRSGRLRREHLAAAIAAADAATDVDDLIAAMQRDGPTAQPQPLLADMADAVRVRAEPEPWSELVVHQISQHAATWFDRAQAGWPPARGARLLTSWREAVAADRGLPVRSGHAAFARRVQALATDPYACLEQIVEGLALTAEQQATWFDALLGSVRGWAAWCAYERWQARLAAGDDDQIVDLLAIRAAWEWLLVEDLALHAGLPAWRDRLDHHADEVARLQAAASHDWLLQSALEIGFQHELCSGLGSGLGSGMRRRSVAASGAPPAVQAVFCIDVRSERFRRALENAGGERVETRGFAGFFGLPVEFRPLGSEATRPQLPGLLAPARTTSQSARDERTTVAIAARRRFTLGFGQRWARFQKAASSAFTFVETCGLFHVFGLLRRSLPSARPVARSDARGLPAADVARLRPTLRCGDAPPTVEERTALAAGCLGAMGLSRRFARLVLLAGHGSSCANNPHQQGLDCGACGGQTGEVNARLLTDLLNDPDVRAGLAAAGVAVPPDTRFLAGLHDTTTDELQLFDVDLVPASHAADLQQLRGWLGVAGQRTRAERAPSLGLQHLQQDAAGLATALRQRATDWAQVRPEWGLADNAAFVVAPRSRTRHLDLGGRVFLHDYEWRSDDGFATLTLILTAPMVVTNWINLQYYASTVDNRRFGSGNKVLHNVVGGSLGVFEGNGGDLRIGLPMQSLHDGDEWRHTPLRLSVFVAAPADAIDDVLAQHEVVRRLVENGWLHLLRLDDDGRCWQRRAGAGWSEVSVEA